MSVKNITMKGSPITLAGKGLSIGQKAPDFTLTDTNLQPVSLNAFKGKVVILSIVPSLDTPVCSIQTRRFNQEGINLGADFKVITISKDLPFAQARFKEALGIKEVITLSDYKKSSFAEDYGVLIQGLELLTRAVFVLDKAGVVQYIEFVKEVSTEPDYKKAIEAAKSLDK